MRFKEKNSKIKLISIVHLKQRREKVLKKNLDEKVLTIFLLVKVEEKKFQLLLQGRIRSREDPEPQQNKMDPKPWFKVFDVGK